MPTEKKPAPGTRTQKQQEQKTPKHRHRRTMAELLQDPKYRAAKGLDPIPSSEGQAPLRPEEEEKAADGAQEELQPAVEAEERKFFETTSYRMARKAPAEACFKRMYPGSWCFELWDADSEECVASYRLPSRVVDEDDAFEYVKRYCNRHMAEVANRNVVIFEVHREFRVEVSQIETVE